MSHGGVPAVDEIVPAGHERRLVGEQKAHERRHFLWPPQSAQWMFRDQRRLDVGGKRGEERRLDIRGTDTVDTKTLRTVLGRGVPGQSDDTVLRCRVCTVADGG